MNRYHYNGFSLKDKIYMFYLRYLTFHPGKRKFRRFVTNNFFQSGIGVISNFNAKFKIKTFDFIDQKIIFEGHYEPETLRLCYSLVGSNDIFIDVGSNFGLYAITIANKSETKVIAIEPNPSVFNRLQINRNMNHSDNLLLFNMAVGETGNLAGMICPSMNNSGNYQISHTASEFYVTVVPLQQIFSFLSIQTIKLLKIDIEGFELYAFKGIDWTRINIQNIIMEYLPRQMDIHNVSSQLCLDYLVEKGYQPFKIDGSEYHIFDSLPESNIWLKKMS